MINAVLFDLDDTLLDRAGGFVRVCRDWYRTLPASGRPADEEQFVERMAAWDRDGLPKHEIYGNLLRWWPGCFASVEAAIDCHRTRLARFTPLDPRTRTLLVRLRRKGIGTAVVTNGSSLSQRSKVRHWGLPELVDAIVVSEEFGAAKPAPEIFRHALHLVGADAAHTLFVGDRPVADIGGAQSVGMRTAWVHHGRGWETDEPPPDHIVAGAWEVGDLLGISVSS
ncbi:MAG: HAD family hydrolase [Spirochaetaceae bacterium]|nr:HAD family hydrolase [Spirochaetaceae bacterium]